MQLKQVLGLSLGGMERGKLRSFRKGQMRQAKDLVLGCLVHQGLAHLGVWRPFVLIFLGVFCRFGLLASLFAATCFLRGPDSIQPRRLLQPPGTWEEVWGKKHTRPSGWGAFWSLLIHKNHQKTPQPEGASVQHKIVRLGSSWLFPPKPLLWVSRMLRQRVDLLRSLSIDWSSVDADWAYAGEPKEDFDRPGAQKPEGVFPCQGSHPRVFEEDFSNWTVKDSQIVVISGAFLFLLPWFSPALENHRHDTTWGSVLRRWMSNAGLEGGHAAQLLDAWPVFFSGKSLAGESLNHFFVFFCGVDLFHPFFLPHFLCFLHRRPGALGFTSLGLLRGRPTPEREQGL